MALLGHPLTLPATMTFNLAQAASDRAKGNLARNLNSLGSTQPYVAGTPLPIPANMRWLYGRDGSLTAVQGQRWWGDNSLPTRSAQMMLKEVDASVAVTCVVAPVHAAQLRVLLDRIEPNHAVIVVQPNATAVGVILHCEDFADAIAAKRLWWTMGADWAARLDQLLTDLPGLPVPGRFVRTPDVIDADAAPVLATAQEIFSRHMTLRTEQIATLRSTPRRTQAHVRRISVIAPSRFRLWSNAGATLARTLPASTPQHVAADWRTVDTDDPTKASPLFIAQTAAECDAIVVADCGRDERSGLLPLDMPWITWVTVGRIPRFDAAGPNDRLLLGDAAWRAGALAAGWPIERMAVAGQPSVARRAASKALPSHLAMLVDLPSLDAPAFANDFSSHRLVWDAVREQLTDDPFAVGRDVNAYLDRQLARAGIDPTTVDRAGFIDRLILPAYAIGIAGVLLDAGVPLRLYGQGWNATPFRDRAQGAVLTREAFDAAVDAAVALVRPWPITFAHEIDAQGRVVLAPAGSRQSLLAAAQDALKAPLAVDLDMPELRAEAVLCSLT